LSTHAKHTCTHTHAAASYLNKPTVLDQTGISTPQLNPIPLVSLIHSKNGSSVHVDCAYQSLLYGARDTGYSGALQNLILIDWFSNNQQSVNDNTNTASISSVTLALATGAWAINRIWNHNFGTKCDLKPDHLQCHEMPLSSPDCLFDHNSPCDEPVNHEATSNTTGQQQQHHK